MKNYCNVLIPSMQDTEDQWELGINQFSYSKFFVARYNRRRNHGENPILYRHTTATYNDVLLQNMNENNWHQFLKESIEAVLDRIAAYSSDGVCDEENRWLINIFEHLRQCFVTYKVMLKEVAYYLRKLLFSWGRSCITKVCDFAGTYFCMVDNLKNVDDEELLFKLADSYFRTGRAPMFLSPRTLPRTSPSPHLEESENLPSFTNINHSFNHTEVRWYLCAFFVAQIF